MLKIGSSSNYVLSLLKDLYQQYGETKHQFSNKIQIKEVIQLKNSLVFKMLNGSTVTISSQEDCYEKWVGKSVFKESKKPFKSGFKFNTVKSVIDHPVLKIPAFTFEEDESIVECRRCELAYMPF